MMKSLTQQVLVLVEVAVAGSSSRYCRRMLFLQRSRGRPSQTTTSSQYYNYNKRTTTR
jgi:hypothetical protein